MKAQIKYILLVIVLCGFTACQEDKVYDDYISIKGEKWTPDMVFDFKVPITDTLATYMLYYNIKYNNDYPFYNLYIKKTLSDTSGLEIQKQTQGMDLFNSKNGFPFGGGMGVNKDYSILSDTALVFPKKGIYNINLKHYMRIDTLPGIVAIGVTLKKK